MDKIFEMLQTMNPKDFFLLIIGIIIYVVFKAINVYVAVKTKNQSKEIEKGVENVIKKKSADYSQTFEGTNIKPEYHYNKTNGTLEEVGKIDTQALIESHIESCFERALARMMPKETEGTVAVAEYNRMRDELNEMSSVFEMANEYRDKYGLGAEVSNQDVFKLVESKASALKDFIDKTYNIGGKKDEKKENEQESK